MVSRETVVQAGVGFVAIAAFLVVPNLLDLPYNSFGWIVAVILFDATIVGGAHLYLALRNEGEGFPVRARWRTVALVSTLAGVAFLANALSRTTTLSGRWITYGAVALGLLAVAVYWYLEARDGYRSSRLRAGSDS